MVETLGSNTASALLAHIFAIILTARAVYYWLVGLQRETPRRDAWLNWLTFVMAWTLFTFGNVLANG